MDTPAFLAARLKKAQFTRIVAFGSSNTERRVAGMHWFDCFELACRNTFGPYTHCINSGRGGETTADLLGRMDRECLEYRPEIVFITIGGNDSNPAKAISLDTYRDNLRKVVDRVLAAGARAVIQTYYGCDLANMDAKRASAFLLFMDAARAVARETDSLLIDHLLRWERLRRNCYDHYRRMMIDAMHVNYHGNLVMGLDIARTFALTLSEDPYFREARAMQALLDQLEAAEAEGGGRCR